jgi:alanine racemase
MCRLDKRLKGQNAVIPRSVFSHMVGSDSELFDAFTRKQIAAFEEASTLLQNAFPHKILRHICNSAGIERFPEAHMTWCVWVSVYMVLVPSTIPL